MNAAIVAIGANRCGSSSSLAVIHSNSGRRNFSFGTMHHELTMPAMLNVFDGAPNVMLHCAAVSETYANGTCLLPKIAISE